MRNTLLYYIAIFAPLCLLTFLVMTKAIDNLWFCIFLFFYAFVYRTITDYLRLLSKQIISKDGFWKLLIPGSRIKYFKELYFF